jgi:hypothetical protein
LAIIARQGGISSLNGGGHFAPGGGGSFSGTIRESFVLLREGLRGNWNRIAGSLTLLAGYTGTLGKFFKSTAADALALFNTQNELSASMARTAMATEQAAAASLLDTNATKAERDALAATAVAARADAVAQEARAEATAAAAEIELSTAKFSVTALAWVTGGLILLAIAAYEVIKHFTNLAKAQKEYNDMVDASRRSYSEELKAMDEVQKSDAELSRWLDKELSTRKDLMDMMHQRIDALHSETEAQAELMRAQGMSATQINAYQISQLELEKQITQATLDQANAKLANAQASLEAARNARDEFAAKGMSINGQNLTLGGVNQARDKNSTVIDYLRDTLATMANPQRVAELMASGKFTPNMAQMFGATSSTSVTIPKGTIPGINEPLQVSLDEAMKKQNALNDAFVTLTKRSDDLDYALGDAKDDLTNYTGDVRTTGDELNKLNTELKIRSGPGATTAALEDMKRRTGGGGAADGLIRSGNFLGLSSNAINSMQAKMVTIAQAQLHELKSINGKIGSPANATGFSF